MANSRGYRFRLSKPDVRVGLLCAGAAGLVCWVVLLGIAVFTEPAGVDFDGTWLALAIIAAFLTVITVLSLLLTHPGWVSGAAGTAAAVVAAIGALLIYLTMPEPGVTAFITHRHALASLAFGFGVVGGGLIVLGEVVVEGDTSTKYAPSKWTPRVGVVAAVLVVIAAGLGVPAMHGWADAANTEASQAGSYRPGAAEMRFDAPSSTMDGNVFAATPGGLLTVDNTGEGAAVAVAMHDPGTGEERWHHRRWNREALQPPVLTDDGNRIALVGKRRDDSTLQHVTMLDSVTGRVVADIPFDGSPGELKLVTDETLLYFTGPEQQTVVGRSWTGEVLWQYEVPISCVATTGAAAGDHIAVALACRAEDGATEQTRVVALDSASGASIWEWEAEPEGRIYEGGMVVALDRIIVDVRRDESPNDGLFAARMFRHDLNAITVADGETEWRQEDLDLGNTYATACVGTLQVAGVSSSAGGDGEGEGDVEPRVVLGECHQMPGTAGARLDLVAYSVESGKKVFSTYAKLGYSPSRDEDASGWFLGLPDGRVVGAVDASLNSGQPDCRLFVAGPGKKQKKAKRLDVPEAIADTGWCRQASLSLSPEGVVVGYSVDDRPQYFALS